MDANSEQCGPLLPATYAIANANDGYFNFFVALQNSQSRGSVQLQSSDPDDPPLIDPNYLGNEYDVLVLIEAVRDALNYMETPTMKRYRKHAIHAPQSADDKVILVGLSDPLVPVRYSSLSAISQCVSQMADFQLRNS